MLPALLKSINDEFTYGHDKKQQTGPFIVEFNSGQFIQICDKASPDFKSNYTNFNEIARELIQTGEVCLGCHF